MFPSHIPSELLSPFHSLFVFYNFSFYCFKFETVKNVKKIFKCFINGNSREMAIETPISTIRRCIFFYNFTYLFLFWLCQIFLVVHRLSLVAVSRGYYVAVVHWFLTAVASLIAKHGL